MCRLQTSVHVQNKEGKSALKTCFYTQIQQVRLMCAPNVALENILNEMIRAGEAFRPEVQTLPLFLS